ncbi:VCBS domain-containing protein, partial [Sphingomicrobium astaxanthinifaciens]
MTQAALGADSEQQPQLPENAVRVAPGPGGSVILPAGVELDDVTVVGRDLVVELPDGSVMIIAGGAVFVPKLIIGGIEVPPTTLAALLIGEEPQPAAGDTPSSGGNFGIPVPDLGPGIGLGDLLPPTALFYTPPEFREVGVIEDNLPEVNIDTPEEPFAVPDAVTQVAEDGLPAGDGTLRDAGEPEGSAAATDSETTTGTIIFSSPDSRGTLIEDGGLTINGTVVTGVGQQIAGQYGILTITAIGDGTVSFSYTLSDNTDNGVSDVFTVVVTDPDGDSDTATLTVNILDDSPTAVDDVVTLGLGQDSASGDVFTGEGSDGGSASADIPGADGIETWGVIDDGSLVFHSGTDYVVEGEWGTLTVEANGAWSYERFEGGPGGKTDTFTYVIIDDDGSESTATLSIVIPDEEPDVDVPQPDPDGDGPGLGDEGTRVFESGIEDGAGGSPGSAAAGDGEKTSGVIVYLDGDSPSLIAISGGIEINGVPIPVGEITVVETELGVLTVDHTVAGQLSYTYELLTNTDGDDTTDVFTITVTDPDDPNDPNDDDVVEGTLVIQIVDDVPSAVDDPVNQLDEGEPVLIDVFANDTAGADGVDLSNSDPVAEGEGEVASGIELVEGTLTGEGTLEYLGGGQFRYTPAPGEQGEISFDYRIVDGDGDAAVATVTIALEPDSTPQVGPTADLSADEDALAGANADDGQVAPQPIETDGAASLSGSVTVDFGDDQDTPSEADAMASFAFTAATVEALNAAGLTSGGLAVVFALSADGHSITGTVAGASEPLLTISLDSADVNAATNEVTYNYSVELAGPLDHPDQSDAEGDPDIEDVFSLPAIGFVVTDADDGDSATGSFVVSLRDDVPTANDDATEVSDSDGGRSATGNVISDAPGADQVGADGAVVAQVDGFGGDSDAGAAMEVEGQYGTLTINADGSYTYVIDTEGANYDAVLALGVGATLEETFTYYLRDADGDVATATLTVTINGSNQPPTGQAGGAVVSEEGLENALPDSDPAGDDSNSATASGSFGFADGDTGDVLSYALGDPSAVEGYQPLYTADGTEIVWDTSDPEQLVGRAGEGGPAVITITIDYGADASDPSDDGYDVVLLQPLFHGTLGAGDGDIESEFDITVPLTVDDGNGGTLETSFAVEVEDDSPAASANEDFDAELAIELSTSDADVPTGTDSQNYAGAFEFFAGGDGFFGGSEEAATSYELIVDTGIATGIFDTATGQEVQLRVDELGVVHGYVMVGSDEVDVFTVSASDDGTVTVTQLRAVLHFDEFGNESDAPEAIAEGALTLRATVSDEDRDTDTADLDLGSRIVFGDDGVEAVADTDEVTDTEGQLSATGNVITDAEANGDGGADDVSEDVPNEIIQIVGFEGDTDSRDFGSADGSLEVQGKYGTLTINADGTYTYTLDPTDPDYGDVIALNDGETLSEVFTYTLSDADDDTDVATLTITINGVDDGPVGEVGNAVVSEEGLEDGIADDDPAGDDTDLPSFTGDLDFSDPDDATLDYVLGAPTETLYTADGTAIIWDTSDPELLIGHTGDPTDPAITVAINYNDDTTSADDSYTVTLHKPVYHNGGDAAFDGDGNIESEVSFTVPLKVTDGTPSNDLDTSFTVFIEDDKPVVEANPEAPALDGLQTSDATLGAA